MKIAILLCYAQMKWKSLSALPCILHKLCCLLSKKKKKKERKNSNDSPYTGFVM